MAMATAMSLAGTAVTTRSTSGGGGSNGTSPGHHHNTPNSNPNPNPNPNPMQAWWESIAKARSAIQTLLSILGPLETLIALQDSDSPAKALLDSHEVARSISARFIHHPAAGSASDPLCRWLYDTFQAADPDLHLVVLRYVPLVAGLYLSRVVNKTSAEEQPLAGFEAVLLALYTTEAKARGGRQVAIHIPDLGQPSLYHAPRNPLPEGSVSPFVGQLCAPLEPHVAVKSTKRASIVAVALDMFYRKISLMPSAAKVEICQFVQGFASQNCACARKFDDRTTEITNPDPSTNPNEQTLIEEMGQFGINDGGSGGHGYHVVSCSSDCVLVDEGRAKGSRVPLPWELLQPILRILGHCLLGPLNPQEVKDAASSATRVLFARVSHDLVPEAILATRSLVRLDNASRANAARVAAAAADGAGSKNSTPTKRKKPEVLLVSK